MVDFDFFRKIQKFYTCANRTEHVCLVLLGSNMFFCDWKNTYTWILVIFWSVLTSNEWLTQRVPNCQKPCLTPILRRVSHFFGQNSVERSWTQFLVKFNEKNACYLGHRSGYTEMAKIGGGRGFLAGCQKKNYCAFSKIFLGTVCLAFNLSAYQIWW